MEPNFIEFILNIQPGDLSQQFHFYFRPDTIDDTLVDLRYHLGNFNAESEHFISINSAHVNAQVLEQIVDHVLTLGAKISVHPANAPGYYTNF